MQYMNFDVGNFESHCLFHKIKFKCNFKIFLYMIIVIKSIYLKMCYKRNILFPLLLLFLKFLVFIIMTSYFRSCQSLTTHFVVNGIEISRLTVNFVLSRIFLKYLHKSLVRLFFAESKTDF